MAGGRCETLWVSIRVGERGGRCEEGIAAAASTGAAAPSVGDFSPFSQAMKRGDSLDLDRPRLGGSCCLPASVRGQAFHWTCGTRAYLYFFTLFLPQI